VDDKDNMFITRRYVQLVLP